MPREPRHIPDPEREVRLPCDAAAPVMLPLLPPARPPMAPLRDALRSAAEFEIRRFVVPETGRVRYTVTIGGAYASHWECDPLMDTSDVADYMTAYAEGVRRRAVRPQLKLA